MEQPLKANSPHRPIGKRLKPARGIMRQIISTSIALAVVAATLCLSRAAEVAGVKLDDSMTVSGTQLVLNGAGIRTKLGAKVYVAGLYLPAKSADADSIINGTGPRKMKLVMKRGVGADTMWGAFREGIEANSSKDELKALEPKLLRMEKAFND